MRAEKEEQGALHIEAVQRIDVASYVAGCSYEIIKYRKRALDQIIRSIDYLEQINGLTKEHHGPDNESKGVEAIPVSAASRVLERKECVGV